MWDATCPDTFAASRIQKTSSIAGSAAAQSESSKEAKYSGLIRTHIFVPVAIESSGVFGEQALEFLNDLGKRLIIVTGDKKASSYLKQRLSLAIQRGNAATILGTMTSDAVGGSDSS
jgi:hypothetical protein